MKIPTKKLKRGFEIPVLGFGTWAIGGEMQKTTVNDAEDITAIKRAVNSGITHIDTAERYAEGHAEELVGQAIKGYDRSKLFLVSKVTTSHLRFTDVLKSAQASLKRLNTDYLDLYLIHAPSPTIPLSETMEAMDELVKKGLVKYIGVSNFNVEHLKEAQEFSHNKIVTNQVHYNLIYREAETSGLLFYCQRNDVILTAFRPVEYGQLAKTRYPIVDKLCQKYQKTPAQIAINWLISQPNVIAISKMTKAEHLKENLGAIGWQLADEDINQLKEKFPNQQIASDFPLR